MTAAIKFRDGGEPGRRQTRPHAQASVGGGHVRQGATAQGADLGAGNVAPWRTRCTRSATWRLVIRRGASSSPAARERRDGGRSARSGHGTLVLNRREFRELGWHITTKSRCAARYAKLVRCSLDAAALAFDMTASPVWKAWRDLFPGEDWVCRHAIGWTSCAVCSTRSRWGKAC